MANVTKVNSSAFIPELASAHAYQDVRGSGGSLGVAIKWAVDGEFLQFYCHGPVRPHVSAGIPLAPMP
jgi:hypothetical protein